MSEMIERVARAICKSHERDPDDMVRDPAIPGPAHPLWTGYYPAARAAIEAMRLDVWSHYPEEMVLAGEEAGASGYENAADIFRAMIDVALRQEPTD